MPNRPFPAATDHKIVQVLGVEGTTAIVQDSLGARYQARLDIRRSKGFGPKPGEHWAIDRRYGVWTFAAIYGYMDDAATIDYGAVGTGTVDLDPFIWNQQSAVTVWTVPHNLGRYPQVTVTDGARTRLWSGIAYPDLNTVTVTHQKPFSGYAICL